MGILNVRYTKDEKEEFARTMLKMIHEGYYIKEIADHLMISDTDAHVIKKKLIASGQISESEIKEIANDRRKREIEEKNREILEKILEGLREGKSQRKIAKDLPISSSRVGQHIQALIQSGKITETEIEEAKRNNKQEKQEEVKADPTLRRGTLRYTELKRDILSFMNLGISTKQMRKIVEVDLETFTQIKKELISEGAITEEQIKAAIRRREQTNRETVYELSKLGYNYVEIAEKIPYSDRKYVERIANALKAEGKITEEEIEEARKKRNSEMRQFIKDGLLKGMTCEEIAGTDEAKKKRMSRDNVIYYYKKFKEEGSIDLETIAQAREEKSRAKIEENRKSKPFDRQIITLTELGFSPEQIMIVTGLSKNYLFTRKKELIEMGLLRKMKTRTVINNREKEAKNRRQSIEKMLSFDQDFEPQVVQLQAEYEKAMLALGEVKEKDMELIRKAISLDIELITSSNIKFITTYFTRNQEGEKSVAFIDSCIETVNNQRQSMINTLNQAKQEIEKTMKKQKAQDMIRTGNYGVGEIARETGLAISVIEALRARTNLENNIFNKRREEGHGEH